MKYSYVCRITKPFSEISTFLDNWATKVAGLLVYEHPADEEVSQTHCHFLIQDSEVQDEQLKRMARVKFPDLKGNECWSWKVVKVDKVPEYITYMTKGKFACKFSKNYSSELLERSRLAWVEPVLGNDKHPGHSKKQDEITELYEAFIKKHDITDREIYTGYVDTICDRILGICRTFTMSHIYHKTGKLPFPGTYKQTAGTLFLRVIETKRPDLFEEALTSLKNIWY